MQYAGNPAISLARLLDDLPFSQILAIVSQYKDGSYTILPYINKIICDQQDTDIPVYSLTKCCRLQTLIAPQWTGLSDEVLLMLPRLANLTMGTQHRLDMTGQTFSSLPHLSSLQILSRDENDNDEWLNSDVLSHLDLTLLQVQSKRLTNKDICLLSNLEVLVLRNSSVTAQVLNFLPKLEICLINGCLYQYIDSTRNRQIMQRIGTVKLC